MADLSSLKASVADLTAQVKRSTSVEAGVAKLIDAVVQQNRDLANKISAMQPDSVSQSDLDDLKQQINDSSRALRDATDPLAAAVVANTPADSSAGTPPAPAVDSDAPPAIPPVSPGANSEPGVDKPQPLPGTSADERAAAAASAPPDQPAPAPDLPAPGGQPDGSIQSTDSNAPAGNLLGGRAPQSRR